jgi:hypothetical protein
MLGHSPLSGAPLSTLGGDAYAAGVVFVVTLSLSASPAAQDGVTFVVDTSLTPGTATGEDTLNVRVIRSDLVLFDFPSGRYGFFSGTGTFEYGGDTYQGAGSLFEIGAITGVTDGSAVPFSIRLNANAELGLTPTILSQIEAQAYRGRPVTISRAYFDPDTVELIRVRPVRRGYVDVIIHAEQAGGEAYIEAVCETRSLDLARSGYRMRTDADQRRVDALDGFLKHVQTAAVSDVYWGRLPPKPPVQKPVKTGGGHAR